MFLNEKLDYALKYVNYFEINNQHDCEGIYMAT